jgi:NADPH:quinone reductase-like Zn-dependent oxidoreductase
MSAKTMRRWVLAKNDAGQHHLAPVEVSIPEPGPGQVRVRVHAAALSYRDLLVRDGQYGVPAAPNLVPLSDGAGVIDSIGADVTAWRIGDRVVSLYLDRWPDGPPGPQMGRGLGSGGENGMLAEYVPGTPRGSAMLIARFVAVSDAR